MHSPQAALTRVSMRIGYVVARRPDLVPRVVEIAHDFFLSHCTLSVNEKLDRSAKRGYSARMSRRRRSQFGLKLFQLRAKHDLTQRAFCERIGYSPSYQCDLEFGRRLPSPEYVHTIVKVFKLPKAAMAEWNVAGARAQGWRV